MAVNGNMGDQVDQVCILQHYINQQEVSHLVERKKRGQYKNTQIKDGVYAWQELPALPMYPGPQKSDPLYGGETYLVAAVHPGVIDKPFWDVTMFDDDLEWLKFNEIIIIDWRELPPLPPVNK